MEERSHSYEKESRKREKDSLKEKPFFLLLFSMDKKHHKTHTNDDDDDDDDDDAKKKKNHPIVEHKMNPVEQMREEITSHAHPKKQTQSPSRWPRSRCDSN